jgi:sulfur carrier protein
MHTVFVNSEALSVSPGVKLAEVLEKSGLESPRGIAVAVNNAVVPRAQWNEHSLHDNDRITIIRATQGG